VCVVIADGHSVAGKSSFAEALAKATDAAIVPGDDFYRVMDDEARAGLSPDEGIRRYYDWERMRDEALSPLLADRAATYRPYDWQSGLLATRSVTIAPAPVVVVEGLFVSRPQLEPFVRARRSPVGRPLARQLERPDSEDWLRHWDAAERLFFEQIRPRQTFDIVVRGEDDAS
jgi:hypothetical protein